MPKVNLEEINTNIYDFKNPDEYDYKISKGITEDIIREISKQKDEPQWVLDIRLKALEIYNKLSMPSWGPDLSELDMEEISTYVKPKSKMKNSWEDVPTDIKNTFEKLGIPKAEREFLSGVGAQYDSEMIYDLLKTL